MMSNAGGRLFFGPLESWRGVEALAVTWFQAPFVDGDKILMVKQGAIFVDFFFVLSGFVITHAYLDKIHGGLGFRDFALLRLARLYPLHLFMLTIWLPFILVKLGIFEAYGLGTDPTDRNNAVSFGLHLLLHHSLGFLETLTWNGPFWSISVEYFTYLTFFLLSWAFQTYAVWIFVAVAAASLAAIFGLAELGVVRHALALEPTRAGAVAVARHAWPLGLSVALAAFETAIPRYVIEWRMAPRALGYFTGIFFFFQAALAVGSAFGNAAASHFGRAYAARNAGRFYKLLILLTGTALVLGCLGIAAAQVIGPWLFATVFTPDFAAYAPVLTLIAIAATLRFV
jgi:peptidoglycan/LPS O-acetylase OafA/YrhL